MNPLVDPCRSKAAFLALSQFITTGYLDSGLGHKEITGVPTASVLAPGRNEPPNHVRFAEHSFAAVPPEGPPGNCTQGNGNIDGCWHVHHWGTLGRITVVSVASAPERPPGVLQIPFPRRLRRGSSVGYVEGWDGPNETDNTEYRAIYGSSRVRVPTTDFEMCGNAKFLGFVGVGQNARDDGTTLDRVPNQIFFQSSATGFPTGVAIYVEEQFIQGRSMRQNQVPEDSAVFTFGSWHHLEYAMTLNNINVANGTLRVWWNGVPIIQYTDVTWRNEDNPSGFYARRWDSVWGGCGGREPKRRDDILQIDHIYLSGIACTQRPCPAVLPPRGR